MSLIDKILMPVETDIEVKMKVARMILGSVEECATCSTVIRLMVSFIWASSCPSRLSLRFWRHKYRPFIYVYQTYEMILEYLFFA